MAAPSPPTREAALEQSLRRVHRSVLILLAACAVVIFLSTGAEEAAPPGSGVDGFTYTATALALVSILARRRRPGRPEGIRSHVGLSLVSLVAAACVGFVGVTAATVGAPRSVSLVYVLAGAIFALRPPLGVAAASPVDPT